VIAAIAFSRDRAAQLDLLLSSLRQNAPGVFEPIHVIWRATNSWFKRGYEVCARNHPNVWFVPEETLAAQVRYLLHSAEFATFFTDDDILFRPLAAPAPDELLAEDDRVLCFSLRLGLNTTRCYPYDRRQGIPVHHPKGETILWEWRQADADWGYPGSLDGHIFRGETLQEIVADVDFPNPNWLEDVLMSRMPKDRPLMAAYRESRLVSIPANRVNETHGNRFGMTHPNGTADLNGRYLDGERISLGDMDFSGVVGAHHELPYVFGR
jgi:hypothetical protein